MKLLKFVLPLSVLFVSFSSQAAFSVSSMFNIADDSGNGVITMRNVGEEPLFINTQVQEITIDRSNNVVRTEYTRDNLASWKISLTSNKLVLKPGEEKDLGVRSLCHNVSCDKSRDIMFLVPLIPSPYDSQEEKESGVNISYGYSPIYIIPTTEPEVDYNIQYKGKELIVKNTGNTFINVYVDACTSAVTSECRKQYLVVSGRQKNFTLPENMASNNKLEISVFTHKRAYERKLTVNREG